MERALLGDIEKERSNWSSICNTIGELVGYHCACHKEISSVII